MTSSSVSLFSVCFFFKHMIKIITFVWSYMTWHNMDWKKKVGVCRPWCKDLQNMIWALCQIFPTPLSKICSYRKKTFFSITTTSQCLLKLLQHQKSVQCLALTFETFALVKVKVNGWTNQKRSLCDAVVPQQTRSCSKAYDKLQVLKLYSSSPPPFIYSPP